MNEPSAKIARNAAQTAGIAKDPVCGMSVNTETARVRTEHDGTTYYFCCAECLQKFTADPARYLNQSIGNDGASGTDAVLKPAIAGRPSATQAATKPSTQASGQG